MALVKPKNIPTSNLNGLLTNTQLPVGSIVQVIINKPQFDVSITSTSWTATDLLVQITPVFSNSLILINGWYHVGWNVINNHINQRIYRNGTDITMGTSHGLNSMYRETYTGWEEKGQGFSWSDNPNSTSQVEYRLYIRRENSGAPSCSIGGWPARIPYIQAIEVKQ